MKLVGSWKAKYFGIKTKNWMYYIGLTSSEDRVWGYSEDYHDGPIYMFKLYYIGFWKH
jgi:hypothetical protein